MVAKQEGHFSYYDSYLGSAAFAVEEALWDDGTSLKSAWRWCRRTDPFEARPSTKSRSTFGADWSASAGFMVGRFRGSRSLLRQYASSPCQGPSQFGLCRLGASLKGAAAGQPPGVSDEPGKSPGAALRAGGAYPPVGGGWKRTNPERDPRLLSQGIRPKRVRVRGELSQNICVIMSCALGFDINMLQP